MRWDWFKQNSGRVATFSGRFVLKVFLTFDKRDRSQKAAEQKKSRNLKIAIIFFFKYLLKSWVLFNQLQHKTFPFLHYLAAGEFRRHTDRLDVSLSQGQAESRQWQQQAEDMCQSVRRESHFPRSCLPARTKAPPLLRVYPRQNCTVKSFTGNQGSCLAPPLSYFDILCFHTCVIV